MLPLAGVQVYIHIYIKNIYLYKYIYLKVVELENVLCVVSIYIVINIYISGVACDLENVLCE